VVEQKQPGPGVPAAEALLRGTEAAVDAASGREGAVETDEARVRKQYADERVAELARQRDEAAAAEAARQKIVADHMAADNDEIEREKKARIDAGKARTSYWEGRPGAEIFTRLLQVIGGTAHDASGQGGPSPVERALEANMAAHEKRLVGAWEATREANALRRQNRTAYEAELERRRIAATNQSLLSIGLIDEQLNAAIAGLSPEKQAAARQAKDAATAEVRARAELKRQEGYNALVKAMEFAPGAGGAGHALTGPQAEAAGALSGMATALSKFRSAKVSQEALEKWRSNQTLSAGAERSAQSGGVFSLPVSAAVDELQRKGFVPRGEFDDIADADKAALLERKRGIEQLAKIISGAAQTDSEVKKREQIWMPQAGDSNEIIEQKTQAFMDFIRDRAVTAGPAAAGIRQRLEQTSGQEGQAAKPAPAAQGPAFDPDDENTWPLPLLQKALRNPKATTEDKRRLTKLIVTKNRRKAQ
jgi:hypothetical protein